MKILSPTRLLPTRRAKPKPQAAAAVPVAEPLQAVHPRLLLYLFAGNLSILIVGMGVLPLLPVYASDFGASPALVGVSLALINGAITLSSLVTSWLAGKVPARAMLVAAGVVGVPAVFGLGQATSLWQFVLFASIVWFTGGMGLGLIGVLTSQHAGPEERGRWFGWIALTTPIGSIVGGLLAGRLVEAAGPGVMFLSMSLVFAVWPLVGFFKLRQVSARSIRPAQAQQPAESTGRAFQLLLWSALFAAITVSINRMGLSLSMKEHGFSTAAISNANVFAGLLAIPVVLWLGPLSDRMGRKAFLMSSYLVAALGGAVLIAAAGVGQFWLATAATLIASTVNGALASALATDVLPKAALGRNLPRLNTMAWLAAIIGSVGSGYVLDLAGPAALYMTAVALSTGAAGLVWAMRGRSLQPAPALEELPEPAPCG